MLITELPESGRGSRRPSRLPAKATSRTSRVWPGSKRTAVPAGMSRRKPRAAARSKLSAGVGFVEMVVGADLDRAVAGVGDDERHRLAADVEFEFARFGEKILRESSRLTGWWTVTSLVPSGKVASTWMSWIISATPSMTSSRVSSWCRRSSARRRSCLRGHLP